MSGLQRLAASIEMGGQPPETAQQPILSRAKLQELVNSVALGERLEPTALMKLAESFVVDVAQSAAELARHRHAHAVDPKDILLYLEREYDMGMNGFVDSEEKTTAKVGNPTVGHQTRSIHATRAASTQQR